MDASKYQKIGQSQTSVKFEPGYAVRINDGDANVNIWTDVKLAQPGFAATFKLPPGNVDLKYENDNISDLTIKPDLKKFDATLQINPLNGRSFKFGLKKDIDCIDTKVQLNYSTVKNEASAVIMPKFKVNGLKAEGCVTLLRRDEEEPSFIINKVQARYKRVGILADYNPAKAANASVFVNLKKAKAGAAFHFNKALELQNIDVLGKTKVNGIKIATIAQVLNDQKFAVKLEGKCPVHKGSSFGACAEYSKQGLNLAAGAVTKVKDAEVKVVLNTLYNESLTGGVKALVKFPVEGVGKAQAGIAINDLANPADVKYNFEITLKH